MDYIASEKGDTAENRDPNSLVANGSSKPDMECEPSVDHGSSHNEDPTEGGACASSSTEDSELCEIPEQEILEEKNNSQTSKELFCTQKIHRKVLDKGIPPDVMPGIKGIKEPLPPVPVSGMLNKHGGKVRLTFKPEQDQLWLGTKERTEKLAMTSIKSIVSEPITEHEEYHIMGLQLGPTEASRYWIYWVPAQYVEAIKDAVLGVWQFF
ncbi:jg19624 [Pararge aegeria aegeria]|uniref:Jg19624 protein n=1 Tax=Pararge aegeria aegeria TaxID=348720 RepID=A0A8S4S625_9NEOP|nr:jg19624 [Pararge aegeria aegeria]